MTQSIGARLPGSHDRLGIYYDALLDSLADGVLSVSPDQRVEVLNATGAKILGVDADDLVGRTLIEALLPDETNDAFIDAILAAAVEGTGTVKNVVALNRAGEERRLAVASTAYRVPAGPLAGRLGVVVTFNDVTEMLRLRAAELALEQELAAENAKLQGAYVKLEEAAERERRVAQRIGLIRTIAAVVVFATFVGIALYNWQAVLPASFTGGPPPEAGAEVYTVVPRPISSRVAVVGAIDAGSVVSVVGPFDGPVRTKRFEYGGSVERGQPLVTIDVSDLQLRLREAQGTGIKARQRLDELVAWNSGVDVSRARRTVAAAEIEGKNLSNKIAQTKLLLNKGIVPADEYNQLVQQQHALTMQLEAAKQDLNATIDRGNEENRRVAEYELLNAQAKVEELEKDLARATVPAPVSGVVLQPPEIDGKRPDVLAVGSKVTRGQTMFTIGDLEAFSIRAKVDEIDINKIKVGQSAVVTGDAFDGITLEGTVTSVAAQAAGESTARAGMATFPVIVQIPNLTPEQRERVHVGMSATMSIVAYDNPAAIVVPPSALKDDGGRKTVLVRRDGRTEVVPVTLGISTPDGIEIRQGLKPDDQVQLGGE